MAVSRTCPGGSSSTSSCAHGSSRSASPHAQPRAVVAPKGGALREARRETGRLERELARLDARQAELHELLAEHATSYERVAELDAELRELTAERARVEDAWLAAAELLEA